jgi:hypothetical protein
MNERIIERRATVCRKWETSRGGNELKEKYKKLKRDKVKSIKGRKVINRNEMK